MGKWIDMDPLCGFIALLVYHVSAVPLPADVSPQLKKATLDLQLGPVEPLTVPQQDSYPYEEMQDGDFSQIPAEAFLSDDLALDVKKTVKKDLGRSNRQLSAPSGLVNWYKSTDRQSAAHRLMNRLVGTEAELKPGSLTAVCLQYLQQAHQLSDHELIIGLCNELLGHSNSKDGGTSFNGANKIAPHRYPANHYANFRYREGADADRTDYNADNGRNPRYSTSNGNEEKSDLYSYLIDGWRSDGERGDCASASSTDYVVLREHNNNIMLPKLLQTLIGGVKLDAIEDTNAVNGNEYVDDDFAIGNLVSGTCEGVPCFMVKSFHIIPYKNRHVQHKLRLRGGTAVTKQSSTSDPQSVATNASTKSRLLGGRRDWVSIGDKHDKRLQQYVNIKQPWLVV